MFICENPSLAGVRQAHRQTVDGGPPDIEAQWWGGDKDPAATRFRVVLHELGLKQSPHSLKGGWCCYITNVIKEANLAKDQANMTLSGRVAQARAWADILRWEMRAVRPRYVFAVGGRAHQVLLLLQKEARIPMCVIHRMCHFSDRGPGRTSLAVKADMRLWIEVVIGTK